MDETTLAEFHLSDRIYISQSDGVHMSTDGGETWERIPNAVLPDSQVWLVAECRRGEGWKLCV